MQTEKTKNKQHLYIFYNTETKRTKIGISDFVYRRLKQIMNTSGCNVVCMFVADNFSFDADIKRFIDCGGEDEVIPALEKKLHYIFKDYRYIGEWFNIHYTEVLNVLQQMRLYNNVDCHIKYKIPLCLSFKTWKQFVQYYSYKSQDDIKVKNLLF